MNILIKTVVSAPFQKVIDGFDEKLFKALKPPILKLEVERFDGCHTGDEVHLKIGLGPLEKKWVSLITDHSKSDNEFFFIDEGKTLPPPLKQWRHTHRVLKKSQEVTEIHDDIEYSSGSPLQDRLIYPALWFQFALRTPVYKRYFKA